MDHIKEVRKTNIVLEVVLDGMRTPLKSFLRLQLRKYSNSVLLPSFVRVMPSGNVARLRELLLYLGSCSPVHGGASLSAADQSHIFLEK